MQHQINNYELLIQKLDAFIRKYYLNKLLRGTLLFVGLLFGFYLFISLVEYQVYFSSTIRKILLFAFGATTISALYYFVANPFIHYIKLGKQISHEQAATIVGKHFTDVKDKLLNVLQLKQQLSNTTNQDLVLASINQKTDPASPSPRAISL